MAVGVIELFFRTKRGMLSDQIGLVYRNMTLTFSLAGCFCYFNLTTICCFGTFTKGRKKYLKQALEKYARHFHYDKVTERKKTPTNQYKT